MNSYKTDLLVIGAGPGGYVAAIKAAQRGLNVVCVDQRATAGGTCLNVGCIPSKALLHSSHKYEEAKDHLASHGISVGSVSLDLDKMMARKTSVVSDLTKGIAFLFRKNGVTFVKGAAHISGPGSVTITTDSDTQDWKASSILIATGSEPTIPQGIVVDEERIVTSTGALALKKVPQHLVVMGGGYIGLELGSVWRRLGAQVTVVEYADRIVPLMDLELGAALDKELRKQGMLFRLGTKVEAIQSDKENLILDLSSATSPHQKDTLACDVALVSIGRKPTISGLGLEEIGVALTDRGFIAVNAHYETSIPGIYAIGDVIGNPMLAHKAEEEGVAVAERLTGGAGHVSYDVIPSVIYTSPEVASVGQTEEQLKANGVTYVVGKFPFLANSRAKANGETTGFVKVLADARTDRILGVHIIGELAGTMIAEAAHAMEMGASSEDIARTCHAHPTHTEALKEAAMACYDKAIHS